MMAWSGGRGLWIKARKRRNKVNFKRDKIKKKKKKEEIYSLLNKIELLFIRKTNFSFFVFFLSFLPHVLPHVTSYAGYQKRDLRYNVFPNLIKLCFISPVDFFLANYCCSLLFVLLLNTKLVLIRLRNLGQARVIIVTPKMW
jgi:hypothetical protein